MGRFWDWKAHTGSINVLIYSIHHFQFSKMSKEWQFDFEGVTQKWCSQLLVMNKLDKQKLYKNAKATMNAIKMDGRGRSKPPTNLYSTRPPQNIFPTHTVNYLPHSYWELPLAPNLCLNHHSSPLTNLFYHPGFYIRDIAKPYSSTPTNSLSKHCVSVCLDFVMDLYFVVTLI